MTRRVSSGTTLLLVSDDMSLKHSLGDNLALQGLQVRYARSAVDAVAMLDRERPDIILLDLEHLAVQELDVVRYVKSLPNEAEVVVLTTVKELEEARNAVRNGAAFYLVKPVAFHDLKQVLNKLMRRMEDNRTRADLEQRVLQDLMAGCPAMEKVLALALKIAPTDSTVLISGESGTGKEFFARIIYRMSRRHDGRFVAMNCGAIPDSLFESELFGHAKGAFTGADRERAGLVEEAHRGTLFLDEVGELSPQAQVKLLRFIQERSFRRVGENQTRNVDTRIIAASNKDLPGLVEAGRFREDLFFRLNVFNLHLPPLRERRVTLPALIKLIVHRFNQSLDKRITRIAPDAEAVLSGYEYPGNIRELENILEHAMVLAEGSEIRSADLPEFMFRRQLLLSGPDRGAAPGPSNERFPSLQEVERTHIRQALDRFNGNYSEIAKQLGISRSTLWRKLKAYRLDNDAPKETA